MVAAPERHPRQDDLAGEIDLIEFGRSAATDDPGGQNWAEAFAHRGGKDEKLIGTGNEVNRRARRWSIARECTRQRRYAIAIVIGKFRVLPGNVNWRGADTIADFAGKQAQTARGSLTRLEQGGPNEGHGEGDDGDAEADTRVTVTPKAVKTKDGADKDRRKQEEK